MKRFGSSAPRVLKSELAGAWYSNDPDGLRLEIEALFASAPAVSLPGPVSALLLPHAGYAYSGAVAAAGIRLLKAADIRRVIVMGPTHRFRLPDEVAMPEATHLRTILGDLPLDVKEMQRLRRVPGFVFDPHLGNGEHSVEIHLPMLQAALGDVPVVPLVVGQLSESAAQRIASGLRPALTPGTLLLISSDFTHYGLRFGYVPFTEDVPRQLEELDQGAYEFIRRRDADGFLKYVRKTGATICGQDAIRVLLHLMGENQSAELLMYRTSLDITGDDENIVCYLSAAVCGPWPHAAQTQEKPDAGLTESEGRALLQWARDAITKQLNPLSRKTDLPPELSGRSRISGAFVTLHRHGELRGCIGEIVPRRPLVDVVAEMAVAAAFEDPRFRPLTPEEWPDVEIEISALTPPRPMASWEDIEAGRHGVWMHKNGHSAVFLPQVATEQGWDVPTMLSHLSRKAGLPQDAWREGATFEVFEAEIFREADATR